MDEMNEREKTIRRFILMKLEKKAAQAGVNLDALLLDDNLFEAGLVDSMGFLELVAAIEVEFGIEVDFSDMDPADFTTLKGLIDLCASSPIVN